MSQTQRQIIIKCLNQFLRGKHHENKIKNAIKNSLFCSVFVIVLIFSTETPSTVTPVFKHDFYVFLYWTIQENFKKFNRQVLIVSYLFKINTEPRVWVNKTFLKFGR